MCAEFDFEADAVEDAAPPAKPPKPKPAQPITKPTGYADTRELEKELAIRAHEKRRRARKRDPGPIKLGQHLLLKEQVLDLVGQSSYSAVWSWMKNSDFPLPIALGPPEGRTTKIAWIAEEVFAWIAARPRRNIGGLKEHRTAQEKNRAEGQVRSRSIISPRLMTTVAPAPRQRSRRCPRPPGDGGRQK